MQHLWKIIEYKCILITFNAIFVTLGECVIGNYTVEIIFVEFKMLHCIKYKEKHYQGAAVGAY